MQRLKIARPKTLLIYRRSALLLASVLCAFGTSAFNFTSHAQSIKTDRAVYSEPALPSLPSAGGKFTDPVFGTQIMRATDALECPAPGCGTYYNQWPTFNSDNTRILIRKGTSGNVIIKAFDPVNFTLGTTLATSPTLPGGVTLEWQGATWSRTDPDLIYVHVSYPKQPLSVKQSLRLEAPGLFAHEIGTITELKVLGHFLHLLTDERGRSTGLEMEGKVS